MKSSPIAGRVASLLFSFAVPLCCVALLSGCERIYIGIFGPSGEVINAKEAFLSQNPTLKVVLSRLQNENGIHESNIAELKKIRRSFSQESSKMMIEQKIADYTGSVARLQAQINRIDEEVERGVALQKFNQMDGGGLASADISNLIRQSSAVLNAAERQRAVSSGIYQSSESRQSNAPVGVSALNDRVSETVNRQSMASAAPQKPASIVDDNAAVPKAGVVDEPLFDNGFRTWTTTNGKSVKARIISTNSTNVVLECEDGTAFAQPVHLLIEEDRLLVSRFSPHSSSASKGVEKEKPFQGESFIAQKTSDGFLNVRSGAGLKNSVVGRIRSGARGIMQVGETIHDTKDQIIWMPVRFGGVSGFVSSNFLKPE